MKRELLEVYSAKTNAVVVKHANRKFPGVLVQGDTLHQLCQRLDKALETLDPSNASYQEINRVRNTLWSLKNHYKSVLVEHDIPMPFSER